jgi:predicted metal-binding protein
MAESPAVNSPVLNVPVLHVCVTCRAGRELAEGETPQGRLLHHAVATLLTTRNVAELREVVCLSSCDHGCAAAISAPGKWSYLLGRLDVARTAGLLTYVASYAASRTGTVLPSKHPASLARLVLGRMPDFASTTTSETATSQKELAA